MSAVRQIAVLVLALLLVGVSSAKDDESKEEQQAGQPNLAQILESRRKMINKRPAEQTAPGGNTASNENSPDAAPLGAGNDAGERAGETGRRVEGGALFGGYMEAAPVMKGAGNGGDAESNEAGGAALEAAANEDQEAGEQQEAAEVEEAEAEVEEVEAAEVEEVEEAEVEEVEEAEVEEVEEAEVEEVEAGEVEENADVETQGAKPIVASPRDSPFFGVGGSRPSGGNGNTGDGGQEGEREPISGGSTEESGEATGAQVAGGATDPVSTEETAEVESETESDLSVGSLGSTGSEPSLSAPSVIEGGDGETEAEGGELEAEGGGETEAEGGQIEAEGGGETEAEGGGKTWAGAGKLAVLAGENRFFAQVKQMPTGDVETTVKSGSESPPPKEANEDGEKAAAGGLSDSDKIRVAISVSAVGAVFLVGALAYIIGKRVSRQSHTGP